MTNNHGFGYTKNRCAAINFKIEAIEIGVMQVLSLGDFVEGFGKFQNNIPGKAFTYHHIGFVSQYIPAFNIPNEIYVFVFFEQGISGLGQ